MTGITYSISESFSLGWKKFKEKALLYLGMTILINVISVFSNPSYQTFMHYPDISATPPYDITHFIANVLYIYLVLGFTKAVISHMRGEDIEFNSFFNVNFMNLVHYFIAMLLTGVLVVIGMIFLIIPGIHIGLRLLFTSYLIVDKNLNFVDAIDQSWNMTKGKTMDLFFWVLIAFCIALLGLIALVFGLFIALPVISLALAYLYVKLSGEYVIDENL